MPNDYSNFTTQDNPDSASLGRPMVSGTGANGEVWDPVTKQWRPKGLGGQVSGTDANGNPVYSNAASDHAGNDPRSLNGEPMTAGRVSSFGNGSSGAAWGGYTGTMVYGPDGQLVYDPTKSGANADIGRAQGLGAAAANRDAYQTDYAQANQDAAMGNQARYGQAMGADAARRAALGIGSQSQALGQRMLQAGAQSQQAAAMSTRGGSLAQAAAMRQQQGGQAAYMQQGNTALQAQLADEMAAGRQQYMGATTQMRGQDAQAQGLNQHQSVEQMNNELAQRGLNQDASMGYEQMGQSINKAAKSGLIGGQEIDAGIDAAASARANAAADRDLRMVGTGASTLATGAAGVSGMMKDDEKRKMAASDERMKVGVRGLAAAAMNRRAS